MSNEVQDTEASEGWNFAELFLLAVVAVIIASVILV